MLEIQQLQVSYGAAAPALADFTLSMEQGEIVALVGESGSGKTTAIRAILGLLPAGGSAEAQQLSFQGRDLLSLTQRQWQALRGRDISMIFQDSGAMLNPIRTIGGQFSEYIRAHSPMSREEAKRRSADMLERMGLPHPDALLASYPFQLSGGQRQRVGIAMAMTFEPKLLLADEPTSALDVTTQAQIIRQMMELRDSYHTSILLVTHNLGVAAYAADRILVMRGGRVVDQGRREELLGRGADTYTGQLLRAVPDLGGKRYV